MRSASSHDAQNRDCSPLKLAVASTPARLARNCRSATRAWRPEPETRPMTEHTDDLLIRGGTLIDPGQGIHGRRDVAFAGGKVAAVAPEIAADTAARTIDATGKLVAPGLV